MAVSTSSFPIIHSVQFADVELHSSRIKNKISGGLQSFWKISTKRKPTPNVMSQEVTWRRCQVRLWPDDRQKSTFMLSYACCHPATVWLIFHPKRFYPLIHLCRFTVAARRHQPASCGKKKLHYGNAVSLGVKAMTTRGQYNTDVEKWTNANQVLI